MPMREHLLSLSWKQYALIVAGLAVVGVGVSFFVGARNETFKTAPVTRGPITQEVLANGSVESPTTASLHFKGSGQLTALNVAAGDTVQAGTVLARQDTGILEAQLQQAIAAQAAQEAQLAVVEEGTRPEEIAVTQAQLENDKQALVRAQAGVVNAIQSAYTASDDAVHNKLVALYNNPRSS